MALPREAATFASLLRAYRLAAELTQGMLAERSGVSARSIQKLEAGTVLPRRGSAASLADALGLSGADRERFDRAVLPVPRRRSSHPPERARSTLVRSDGADSPGLVHAHSRETIGKPAELVALSRPTPTNVPWPISRLIGRERDLAAVITLIAEDGQRLVTLTGVGGAGKTRLAVRVAADVLDTFADGVWFVDLTSTSDPGLVPGVVAGALDVREVANTPILETLLEVLRRKRLLLVLDNCEHLIDACAVLARTLLTANPDLHILATSREPLQISGEQRWHVEPLALPSDAASSLAELAGAASVRLFVERAQEIDASFIVTDQNVTSVARICARLDGIPLAIELAASRIRVLGVEQVAERLDDSFRLLVGRSRAGPTRQQTMQSALDWSYDLLADGERTTFSLLSTFSDGFDLDAAEAICERVESGEPRVESDPPLSTLTLHSPLDILSRLVDKSLVVVHRGAGGRRYRLLEPVRQYAQRALRASGEQAAASARHAAYYAALAEQAASKLHGPEQTAWLDRLEGERENLRVALGWISEHGEIDAGLRLATALAPYWEARGYLSEGRRWLDIFLAAARAGGASSAIQLSALLAAGSLAVWQRDTTPAGPLLREALAAARALADRRSEVEALCVLSVAIRYQGMLERAVPLSEESVRLAHELRDEAVIASVQYQHAITLYQYGLQDPEQHGLIDRALSVCEDSLVRQRRLEDVRSIGRTAAMLGRGLIVLGDHVRAAPLLREGISRLIEVGERSFMVDALGGLARAAQLQGNPRQAVQWLAATLALRQALGMRGTPRNDADDQTLRETLQHDLTEQEFDAAYAAGSAMTLDQVLASVEGAL